MTDGGIDSRAARQRLALLCDIEWLEEIRTAHRGLFDRDEVLAALDAALDEALRNHRGKLAALAVA
jgi:hypothetical protein